MNFSLFNQQAFWENSISHMRAPLFFISSFQRLRFFEYVLVQRKTFWNGRIPSKRGSLDIPVEIIGWIAFAAVVLAAVYFLVRRYIG